MVLLDFSNSAICSALKPLRPSDWNFKNDSSLILPLPSPYFESRNFVYEFPSFCIPILISVFSCSTSAGDLFSFFANSRISSETTEISALSALLILDIISLAAAPVLTSPAKGVEAVIFKLETKLGELFPPSQLATLSNKLGFDA